MTKSKLSASSIVVPSIFVILLVNNTCVARAAVAVIWALTKI